MSQTVKFGFSVDKDDGVSPPGGSPGVAPSARVSINGGTLVDKNETTPPAYDDDGLSDVVLNETDTNTPGDLLVVSDISGSPNDEALPVVTHRTLLPSHIYDWFVAGTGTLEVTIVPTDGSGSGGSPMASPPEDEEVTLADRPGAALLPFAILKLDQGDLAVSRVGQAIPDPPDYYGGQKWPMVTAFGRLSRKTSTDDGRLSKPSMSLELVDTNRRIRTLLGNGEVFDGRIAEFYAIDDESRRAGEIPRMLARGHMRQPTLSPGYGVSITIDDPLSREFATEIPKRRISADTFTGLGQEGIAPDTPVGLSVPIVLGDFSTERYGRIPTIPLDTEVIDGTEYGRLLVSGDAMSEINRLFAGDEEKTIVGAGSSTAFLVPGQYRWLATSLGTDMVRRINGEDYCLIYAYVGSEAWVNARDRKVPITVCGIGAGTNLLTAPLQLRWLLINHIFGNKVTDTEEDTPLWGVGDPKIDEDSFEVADDVLQDRAEGGYRSALILNKPEPAENVIAKLLRSGDMRLAYTRQMRLFLSVFDVDATAVAAFNWNRLQIRSGFSVTPRLSEQANKIIYSFGERYTRESGLARVRAEVQDDASIAAYGRTIPSEEIDFPYLHDVLPPVTAPSLALGSSTFVTNGVHRVALSYGFWTKSTLLSPYAVQTVTLNKTIQCTGLEVSDDPLVSVKSLWMTKAGEEEPFYLVDTIDNLLTAANISIGDGSLFTEQPYTNGHETIAYNNAAHRLARNTVPRHAVILPLVALDAADREIGEVIAVTHPEGVGASGYVARRLEIERLTIDLDALHGELECLDVDQVPTDPPVTAWRAGEPDATQQPVLQTDPSTGTGPIPGGKQVFPLGSLGPDGRVAVASDTYEEFPVSLPQAFTREEVGERPMRVTGKAWTEGGATLTLSLFRVGDFGTDIAGSWSTSAGSGSPDQIDIDLSAELLVAGEGHRYEPKWKMSDNTNHGHADLQIELY